MQGAGDGSTGAKPNSEPITVGADAKDGIAVPDEASTTSDNAIWVPDSGEFVLQAFVFV